MGMDFLTHHERHPGAGWNLAVGTRRTYHRETPAFAGMTHGEWSFPLPVRVENPAAYPPGRNWRSRSLAPASTETWIASGNPAGSPASTAAKAASNPA